MQRTLRRSRNNRVIAGVCAGLGEYFGIDPTIVRILFVLLIIFPLPAFIPYLILWLVMPEGY